MQSVAWWATPDSDPQLPSGNAYLFLLGLRRYDPATGIR